VRSFIALSFALCVFTGCGSDGGGPAEGAGGAGSGGTTAETGGSGGIPMVPGTAQVRFQYKAEWKDHLGACASISDYRIKFGANPVPVSVSIETTPDSMTDYKGVDGRLYKDDDVLHIFSCIRSQTSKSTMQEFGKFGADLPFASGKRFTVTLGGDAATVAEDP
jgi:hypothetical protein